MARVEFLEGLGSKIRSSVNDTTPHIGIMYLIWPESVEENQNGHSG